MSEFSQSGSNLKQALDLLQEVVILCFYKGFPITCNANFQGVRGNTAIFKVDCPGSVCLGKAKNAWILGGELFEAMKVTISSFDIASRIVEVTNITYAGMKFGNRRVVRVEPEEDIPVTVILEDTGDTVNGSLADISLGGAGVFLEENKSLSFKPGELVSLQLYLPHEPKKKILMTGKIISQTNSSAQQETPTLVMGGKSLQRISIGFSPSIVASTPILSYIALRRAGLMKEVDELYNKSKNTSSEN